MILPPLVFPLYLSLSNRSERERERVRERVRKRERKRELKGRERDRERHVEYGCFFIFKRNDGCLSTFQLSSLKIQSVQSENFLTLRTFSIAQTFVEIWEHNTISVSNIFAQSSFPHKLLHLHAGTNFSKLSRLINAFLQ